MVAPFFDRFYECLEDMHHDHAHKYLETFFYHMLPRMQIEDRHIVQLMSIKSRVADNNSTFMNMLQDGIELLIRSKRIRELAKL